MGGGWLDPLPLGFALLAFFRFPYSHIYVCPHLPPIGIREDTCMCMCVCLSVYLPVMWPDVGRVKFCQPHLGNQSYH